MMALPAVRSVLHLGEGVEQLRPAVTGADEPELDALVGAEHAPGGRGAEGKGGRGGGERAAIHGASDLLWPQMNTD